MLTVPTIEDCARYAGLDATGLKRREHAPTLQEIRAVAPLLRTPAGVWLPRVEIERWLEDYAIRIGASDGPWWTVGDADYNRLMYGVTTGTGYWSEWIDYADKEKTIKGMTLGVDGAKAEWSVKQEPGEVFLSFPKTLQLDWEKFSARYPEATVTVGDGPPAPGTTPLPPAISMTELAAKIDAQYKTALANMQKTIAGDLAGLMFNSNPLFKRLSGDGLKAEDFNMPPFRFGWSGFKEASGGIGVGGAYITRPFYLTPEAAEMARLERQGFGIEVINEEKTGE